MNLVESKNLDPSLEKENKKKIEKQFPIMYGKMSSIP